MNETRIVLLFAWSGVLLAMVWHARSQISRSRNVFVQIGNCLVALIEVAIALVGQWYILSSF